MLRLKSPTSEGEAIENALRVLQTQLKQIEEQTAAASGQLTGQERRELEQTRRSLEELVRVVGAQAVGAAQNIQQRAMQLNLQMANLNRQREQLIEEQKALEAQIRLMNGEFERMKIELRKAEEAKGR